MSIQKAVTYNESPLNLYCEGDDPSFNLSTKLEQWLVQHQELISAYSGTVGNFEAWLDITWK